MPASEWTFLAFARDTLITNSFYYTFKHLEEPPMQYRITCNDCKHSCSLDFQMVNRILILNPRYFCSDGSKTIPTFTCTKCKSKNMVIDRPLDELSGEHCIECLMPIQMMRVEAAPDSIRCMGCELRLTKHSLCLLGGICLRCNGRFQEQSIKIDWTLKSRVGCHKCQIWPDFNGKFTSFIPFCAEQH